MTEQIRHRQEIIVACNYCGCREFPLIGRLTVEHETIANSAGPAPDWPAVPAALERLHRHGATRAEPVAEAASEPGRMYGIIRCAAGALAAKSVLSRWSAAGVPGPGRPAETGEDLRP